MSRLFILGNGYDIARRGDTGYENFKSWLKDHFIDNCDNQFYKDGTISFSNWNNVSELSKDIFKKLIITKNAEEEKHLNFQTEEIEIQRKKLACAILFDSMRRIGDDATWKNFEEDLAKIPFDDIIDEFEKYNKTQEIKLKSMLGSPVSKEVDIVTAMPGVIVSLFVEWINSLKPLSGRHNECVFEKKIIKSICPDDVFIIFNYTKTLEEILKITDCSNIYHIHGIKDYPETMVVGHNCKEKLIYLNCNNPLDSKDDYIAETYEILYKNPEKVIQKNNDLCDKINNVTEIYEFGWSCSETDHDYIEKLAKFLKGKQCKLYLNDYENQGKNKMTQWVNYGFPRDLITFYIEEKNTIKMYLPGNEQMNKN